MSVGVKRGERQLFIHLELMHCKNICNDFIFQRIHLVLDFTRTVFQIDLKRPRFYYDFFLFDPDARNVYIRRGQRKIDRLNLLLKYYISSHF